MKEQIISSKLSSTIQNATIAAASFPKGRVKVIDSRNLSTGIGLLVLKAAQAAVDGHSSAEILALIERCSSVQHFIGSLLKIRPIVKVIDGAMTSTDKVRGKREKARHQLLDNALAQKDNMDAEVLFITHSSAPEESAYIKQQIEQQTSVKQVYITETGCVVASRCGPHTVGIVFAKK